MDAYCLLNRNIQNFIYEKGWKALRPIQKAAIIQAEKTDHNLILAAPTASGKTEAAFLPTINAVSSWEKSVKIIYISPLVALINDQFQRILDLCSYLDVHVTRWHGEASTREKEKLIKNPNGILLITPESLEAMITMKPAQTRNLFSGCEWILIDEIHSFMNTNRGLQLRSLLERLQEYIDIPPRYIGMSATIHKKDYGYLKSFFSNHRETKVLLDPSKNELEVQEHYFEEILKNQSNDAVNYIFNLSQEQSMLLFPNSRKMVEYLTVELNKKKRQYDTDAVYFAHHSSISKNSRQMVEAFAKHSNGHPFTISCTSTLEMGIDIGSVDRIVQYNAPLSVSSLGQRLGRSGRKTRISKLDFIATTPWDLIQGLAAISLYKKGILDSQNPIFKPYDVLAHQILARLIEKSGIKVKDLKRMNQDFASWASIRHNELSRILNHLVKRGYIEIMEDEAIIGRNAEELLKRGEFYALFLADKVQQVYFDETHIGDVPANNLLSVGDNIFLAGEVWKITQINRGNECLYVTKAKDGTPPHYSNGNLFVTQEIRDEMKAIIENPEAFDFGYKFKKEIEAIRVDRIDDTLHFSFVGDILGLRTFMNTRVNVTLVFLLNMITKSKDYQLFDNETLIYGPNVKETLRELKHSYPSDDAVRTYLDNFHEFVKSQMSELKFADLLPYSIQIDYIVFNLLALQETHHYVNEIVTENF